MKKNLCFIQGTYVAERSLQDGSVLLKLHQEPITLETEEDSIPGNDYYVRIKAELTEDYNLLNLQPGDELSLMGARIYGAKGDSVFLKVTSLDELVKHEKVKVLDLGIEDAFEKFI